MDSLIAAAIIAIAYLVGALPFGWLIARAKGVDIFAQGSGNIGATNVGRVLGRTYGLLVFVLDFAKGALPVLAALRAQSWLGESFWAAGWLAVAAGLAAFLGHCYPVYLGFRGGKGVATGAGVVAVLVPVPALAAFLAWLVVVGATRYVSLASVVGAVVLGFVHWTATGFDVAEPRTWFCLLAGILVIVRHRANLVRLAHGTENRLKESTAMIQLPKTLHALALGLWFGTSVFFTFVVALSLFDAFESLGQRGAEQRGAEQRPAWFPLPPEFAKVDSDINGPKEQGSRAAGFAVSPMFTWYFLIQGICGLVALGTAFAWVKQGKVHQWRAGLLFIALVAVLIGWPIERHVSELRGPRNQETDGYLQSPSDEAPRALAAMKEARSEFGRWHTYSLLLNLVTILAVTGAMALAGNVPQSAASGLPPP